MDNNTPHLFKVGDILEGTIIDIKDYGAFMIFNYDIKGLLHISEITNDYVRNIRRFLKIGMIKKVKVLDVDEKTGFIKVSIKKIEDKDLSVNLINGKYREEVDKEEINFGELEQFIKG